MSTRPLSAFFQAAQNRSEAEFCADYPNAVFVISPFRQLEDTTLLQTIRLNASKEGALEVARVRKRGDANPFQIMVTIGRARNNDIVLKAPGVSKFHAYVRLRSGPDGEDLLADAGSTYGTRLNGNVLQAQVDKRPLRNEDEVILGDSIRLNYFDSKGLYAFLTSLSVDVLLGREPTPER